jgi:hypothetical protein
VTVAHAVKSALIVVVIIAHGNSFEWLQPAKVVKDTHQTNKFTCFFRIFGYTFVF